MPFCPAHQLPTAAQLPCPCWLPGRCGHAAHDHQHLPHQPTPPPCRQSGKLGVDFSLFDATQPRPSSAIGSADISRSGSPAPSPAAAVAAVAQLLPANGGGAAQAGLQGRLGERLSPSPFDAQHAGILPPV